VIDGFGWKNFRVHESLKFGGIFGCLRAEGEVHALTLRKEGQFEE
jgi:hypothetical protein